MTECMPVVAQDPLDEVLPRIKKSPVGQWVALLTPVEAKLLVDAGALPGTQDNAWIAAGADGSSSSPRHFFFRASPALRARLNARPAKASAS